MKMEKYIELERKISELLPQNPGEAAANIEEISSLTDLMINERDDVDISYYAHSVCHLFDYGKGAKGSYLNSTSLLELAEKLVNATFESPINLRMLDSNAGGIIFYFYRVIESIVQYNLDNMEKCKDGFAFKPAVFNNPALIEQLTEAAKKSCPVQYVAFCTAKNVEEFFQAYVESLKQESGVKSDGTNNTETLPGVFVDVDDTLYNYEGIIESTQTYLMKKIEDGIPVTVFTGGDPKEAAEKLKKCGIDGRLLDVKSKSDYIGKTLEVCIDDTKPPRQGFMAKTYYSSGQKAMDAEYKTMK